MVSIYEEGRENPTENNVFLLFGGDGSLNYFINNVVKNFKKSPRVIYIPAGTANDFAKSLKLELVEYIDGKFIKDILSFGQTITVPTMKCNDLLFINAATCGAPAQVTESGNDTLKEIVGQASYYFSALKKIISPDLFYIESAFNNEEKWNKVECFGFFVGQGLFAGGGARVANTRIPLFKEEFSFLTVNSSSLTENISIVSGIQNQDADNTDNDGKDILIDKKCVKVKVRSEVVIPVKLDGEEYESKTLEFSKGPLTLDFYLY